MTKNKIRPIINTAYRSEGKFEIFANGEWQKMDGEHAACVYDMYDKNKELQAEVERLRVNARDWLMYVDDFDYISNDTANLIDRTKQALQENDK